MPFIWVPEDEGCLEAFLVVFSAFPPFFVLVTVHSSSSADLSSAELLLELQPWIGCFVCLRVVAYVDPRGFAFGLVEERIVPSS